MMNFIKSVFITLIIFGSIVGFGKYVNTPTTIDHLQSISVLINGKGTATGSGTIINKNGNVFVITAYHVIANLKKDDDTFENAKVSQIYIENGVTVGVIMLEAEMIRYSSEIDFAILRVVKKESFKDSVYFCNEKEYPPIGTSIKHVGCFYGVIGYNSYSEGIIAQHNRKEISDKMLQITCPHYAGSSGGGIFDQKGEYIGMVLATHDSTYGLATPIQELRNWSRRAKMGWIFNNENYAPKINDLKINPLNVK